MIRIRRSSLAAAIPPLLLAGPAGAGSVSAEIGLDDLIKRIGEQNIPTGAGVVVAMPEAGDDFYPNRTLPEFQGKVFHQMSGPSANSSHATTVARRFYGARNAEGENTSVAPGIPEIYLYSAGDWAQSGYLRATSSSSVPPAATPAGLRVINNSWVGSFGPDNEAFDTAALRRADFVVTRDELLIVCGVHNAEAPEDNLPLMSHIFNGLTVGLPEGGHQVDPTLEPYDGPGRMKPEMVAPDRSNAAGCCTSFSAPVVAACGALLIQTANEMQQVSGVDHANRSEVIKAVLLAGARHRPGWSNHPDLSGPTRGVTDQPLDPVFGVDLVNIDRSHRILTGGEHAGAAMPPDVPGLGHAGWSLPSVELDASRFYRFRLDDAAAEAAFLITWHRQVEPGFSQWSVADFDLFLWRIDESDELVTLVGDPGLAHFAGGNVVSESPVDNIEHLYVTGLQTGEYVLEVRRQDAVQELPTWEVAVAWLLPEPPPVMAGDANNDGTVDVMDLVAIILAWGPCGNCKGDFNQDGVVDILDLIQVILNWG